MGIITKLFGVPSKSERAGASMGPSGRAWEVGPVEDAPAFFRALHELLPKGSFLYLEDTCSKEGVALASRYSVEPRLQIALGTIWPRPNSFHIPLSLELATELAEFAEHHVTPEIAVHLHAYHGDEILLEWHDAFSQNLRLATTIPESKVQHFCDLLHCRYKLETA